MRLQKTRHIIGSLVLVSALASCGDRNLVLPGERLSIRPGSELQVQNASTGIALGAAVSNAEWSQRGGNASHLMPNLALSTTPTLRYSVDIGRGDSRRARLTSEPVIGGGAVFTMDSATVVRAFSPGGALLWENELTPITDRSGDGFGGGEGVVEDGFRLRRIASIAT